MDVLEIVKALRQKRQEHPVLDTLAGFVPGVGVAQAIDDVSNSDLPWWDRALGAAGAVPGGRVLQKAVKGAGGKLVDILAPHVPDPDHLERMGQMVDEMDMPTLQPSTVHQFDPEHLSRTSRMLDQIGDNPIYADMKARRAVPVDHHLQNLLRQGHEPTGYDLLNILGEKAPK